MMRNWFPLIALLALPLCAENRISVTVVDSKTGKPAVDLKADDFTLYEDKLARKITTAEYSTEPIDVMFLLDTSLVGEAVKPVAEDLITRLKPKEQMAIVSFHSSADLIQDFTSSQQLLARAINSVSYGNTPRVIDGVFAAIDTGMKNATYRKVVLLLTTGYEGDSQMTEHDLAQLARKKGVSIYPIYATGRERGLFDRLARRTGGACFNLKEMRKASNSEIGARIFEVVRGHYTLTAPGNLALGEKLRVEIARPGKWFASALPLEWE
jgi:VWFA-related protein